jgi:2-keto-4-pentenoate hydratase/2-oxohepta-3-ene-1,7-dioic acid hydratase in catechol pathway
MALPKAPILFTKPRTALADPYPAVIPVPKCAQDGTSDYEAELCVVIGKSGRNIPEEKALDYVLGYTASNDVSARTMQMLTTQWSFSKGLDGSCPLGQPQIYHSRGASLTGNRPCSCFAESHLRPSQAVN